GGQRSAEQAARALTELTRVGITVDNFSLGQPSLDEVFLALTGHDTRTQDTQRAQGSQGSQGNDTELHDTKDEAAA
ncbi:daunorubicin/doxorubicin resistance ABC transporter ATP-binding protein DrrA, partial [Streptomyces sp. K1PN6]|nr:daunorubicin/doxorubicin resistance ABC transporter ATP-binding protein DrrA [Streptomyces acidicola]